jgi:FtsP/CotA-like multicopper oxidase with cupredoxin domain/peroxiredoxin
MRANGSLRKFVFATLFAVLVAVATSTARAQPPAARVPQRPGLVRITPLQRTFSLARAVDARYALPEDLGVRPRYELMLTTGRFGSPEAAGLDPSIPKTFELLCYNGKRAGPTIRVRRGSKFQIHLVNALNKGDKDVMPPGDAAAKYERPHGFCTTNLHTHGLHVSPSGNSDNILDVSIDPGADYLFDYEIDPKHPSGTFWYHPHKHGAVAYQVSNGVAGALIVEGTPGDAINDLDDIPEIAATRENEKILLLQLYNYRVDDSGPAPVGRIDAMTIYNEPADPDVGNCKALPIGGSATGQVTAINGLINPTIEIAPGEVQRWRIIDAGWDVIRPLVFVDDRDNPTGDLRFREIAIDGLATGTMRQQSPLTLAPGQRSDVLIKAPMVPRGETRIYHLKQLATSSARATHNRATDASYLAKIVVRGEPRPMTLPEVKDLARCRPFDPVGDDELVPPTIPDGLLRFAAKDPSDPSKPETGFYTINDRTFHAQEMQPPILTLGTAQEWTIRAEVSNHPFHLHVNPFQVVSYTCKNCPGDALDHSVQLDVWRDTLYILEGETYKIRTRFRDYDGDAVLHCHILDHEDQGMMMRIRFVDPKKPRPPGKALGLKESAAVAPAFRLPDARGLVRESGGLKGKEFVLVFFQGAECGHCAAQLRDLVREAREKIGADAEIVAVSSRRVADPARSLSALGVTASDRFLLLVDEDHRAFREFGCYGEVPKHGLFLIDGRGIIRASYVGEAPYEDTAEVIRRVREMRISRQATVAR